MAACALGAAISCFSRSGAVARCGTAWLGTCNSVKRQTDLLVPLTPQEGAALTLALEAVVPSATLLAWAFLTQVKT
jgi:hypothetical protein